MSSDTPEEDRLRVSASGAVAKGDAIIRGTYAAGRDIVISAPTVPPRVVVARASYPP